jgi:hypothetical protein
VSPRKLVTRQRPRTYSQEWVRVINSQKAKDSHEWRDLPQSKSGGRVRGKPRYIEVLIPKHTGWEIAEEVNVCPECSKTVR